MSSHEFDLANAYFQAYSGLGPSTAVGNLLSPSPTMDLQVYV